MFMQRQAFCSKALKVTSDFSFCKFVKPTNLKVVQDAKKLYISDLDGTLLNSNKEITAFSAEIINRFIDLGGMFSVATARTAYGCEDILKDLKINIPIILMNGVCLYFLKERQYVSVESINQEKVLQIEKALVQYKAGGFMYTYEGSSLSIYYKDKEDLKYTQYYSKKAIEYCKEIAKVDSFSAKAEGSKVIYFTVTGEKKAMERICNSVSKIPGINYAFYLNVYNELYCLEIFDEEGSKEKALIKLKRLLKAEDIIVFGDNYNDIGMIKLADESLAPENAVLDVKDLVTGIIGSNDDDGVACYLKNLYNL